MCTTPIGDMSMNTFPNTEANGFDYSSFKKLLPNPDHFRLVIFKLPFSESLHLKCAMGDCWDKHYEWCSVTISEFIDDLISAIHTGTMPLCREKFENPDILIVDDLQHIAGKEATQEEFYRIIKHRIEHKKTTIIFSQLSLTQMRGMMRDELFQLLSTEYNEDGALSFQYR